MDEQEEQVVTFESEEWQPRPEVPQAPVSGLAGWLMRHAGRIVKNEASANALLISFAFVLIFLAVYFLVTSGGEKAVFKAPPGQRVSYPADGPPRLETGR